ncbi:PilW family protein [Lysobacter panacisoli]|uniref:Prepilin-type N-terminal cleavage/methylation domain-containing protein n=1 Tax=Lysobacter panacisoli TaxID=1255263 RepID=A0ABP9LJQ7_9GAMM|nr:PilW family protein [Lysobacter panacisoli]
MTTLQRHKAVRAVASPRHARGFSLIELMISLLLGMLVVAAAGGLFLSNQRIYASTETLNRIQENSRVSFEIMSRDLREAGGIPCGNSAVIVNLLSSRSSDWWTSFDRGMRGYMGDEEAAGTDNGAAAAERVDGTDAIDIHLANENEAAVSQQLLPASDITMASTAGFAANDIVVACNTSRAYVFQISGISGNDLAHATGGTAPGNCVAWLVPEEPAACGGTPTTGSCLLVPTGTAPDVKCVPSSDAPAIVARVSTMRWYIGNNGRGGRSLYRSRLTNTTAAGAPTATETVEVAEGVSGMQLLYRANGGAAFVEADAVADWRTINAVQVTLTIEGSEGALRGQNIEGTDGNVLSRRLTHVVAVRNREGVL